jgi:hypothetical protein
VLCVTQTHPNVGPRLLSPNLRRSFPLRHNPRTPDAPRRLRAVAAPYRLAAGKVILAILAQRAVVSMSRAMDDQNTRDCSPNVGDVRWLGAKSVMLLCQTCQHRQVANIEQLPDDTSLALIASKFVCPQCQQGGAYVLPSWGPSAATDPTA